jgi:hypothetical protein
VNVVDVNVTTRNKVTEKHVLKDKEPRKTKSIFDPQWWRQFNKFKKQKPRSKGHPHPWGNGTQLG